MSTGFNEYGDFPGIGNKLLDPNIGFNILYSVCYYGPYGYYYGINQSSMFWSSTDIGEGYGDGETFILEGTVFIYNTKYNGIGTTRCSVRLIKD